MKLLTLPALLVTLPVLAACTENGSSDGPGPSLVQVTSSDDACELSATEAPAGTIRFEVTNTGSEATEFYLYAEDGQRVVGEVENIGPGLDRELVVSAPEGSYVTACKPGMRGDGLRGDFTVTPSDDEVDPSAAHQALVEQATSDYTAYVREQSQHLLAGTRRFVGAYVDGDDARARSLYAPARVHWERIETVAESFGDLDPKMDAREADLEPGQEWTGWHRLEKDLWPHRAPGYTPLTEAERATYAEDLLANTRVLHGRIQELDFSVDQVANGSRGLLEEVATGKVTGEEEFWSRTDLWDFQANVDGARVGFEVMEDLVERKDEDLAATLERRFSELQDLLDRHRDGDGFRGYDELSTDEVKRLADAVNALSEPLSRLTATVLA